MKPYWILILALLFYSCSGEGAMAPSSELDELPADTGGVQSAHPLESEDSPLGYLLYEPSGVTQGNYQFPLLIFLHGSGEKDATTNPDSALATCARGVVSGMLKWGKWNPPVPMIVASPHSGAESWDKNGNLEKLRAFIQFLTKTYAVNPQRIYMTGYSMGGYGTYSYLSTFGDTSLVAAGAPIAGGGWAPNGKKIKVPIWAFHGDQDAAVSWEGDVTMIDSINATQPEVPAKITIFPNVSHNDVVIPVYDASAMGKESPDYAPFDENLFTWMMRYTTP